MKTPPNELLMTREFDAPRDLVWEAFSSGEHVGQWIAPDGFRAECVIELRKGGRFDIRMIGLGMDHVAKGTVLEVVKGERIVWTFGFSDVPGVEMRTTVTFASRGAKTELTVRQNFPAWESLTPAQQELMRPRVAGAPTGWTQSLQHLADYLKR